MARRKPSMASPWSFLLLLFLLVGSPRRLSALSITVNDVECVYEFILFEGDAVTGSFVVVDHDIFWGSDHPGIDLVRAVLSRSAGLVDRIKTWQSKFVLLEGDTFFSNFLVIDNDIFIELCIIWTLIYQYVTSPGGNTVHTIKGSSGDKFEFKAPRGGMYKFCFHNPQRTPETVSFYIHSGHIPNEHQLAKDEHLDPINVKIAELREALESVTAEQKYLRAREVRHRYTNESTRRRLILYTVLEYLLLAFASTLQVVYIRRLFSKSVAYNRV